MAKFKRYDPRNKKANQHRSFSKDKDLRIRYTDENVKKINVRLYEDQFSEDEDLYD